MEFTVVADQLLKVLPFVSDEETRPNLNGVLLKAGGEHVAVATTGHIMAVVRKVHTADSDIIAKATKSLERFLRDVVRSDTDSFEVKVSVAKVNKKKHLVMSHPAVDWMVTVPVIDGQYPDYTKVLHKSTVALGRIMFNPELVVRFGGAQKLKKVRFEFTGSGSGILVTNGDPDFYGVLMPMRDVDRSQDDERVGQPPPSWTGFVVEVRCQDCLDVAGKDGLGNRCKTCNGAGVVPSSLVPREPPK